MQCDQLAALCFCEHTFHHASHRGVLNWEPNKACLLDHAFVSYFCHRADENKIILNVSIFIVKVLLIEFNQTIFSNCINYFPVIPS